MIVNPILSGIVGSRAHGLATSSSDIDRMGIFAVDTQDLHVMHRPEETHVVHESNQTWHEAAKWCRLALKCNPTIIELVWLPPEYYEFITPLGHDLIGHRRAFLSEKSVKNSYLGYASAMLKKIDHDRTHTSNEARQRAGKNARHLLRLCWQGYKLYTTGELPIRVDDPTRFHAFAQRITAGHTDDAHELLRRYEHVFHTATTVLPLSPDENVINRWLRFVRIKYLGRSS